MNGIELLATADVFKQNEVYNLLANGKAENVGAVRVEVASIERDTARGIALKEVAPKLSACIEGGKFWELSADSRRVPANRVTRYRNRMKVARDTICEEHQNAGGLRLFSAALVSEVNLLEVVPRLQPTDCSFLTYLPAQFDTRSLIRKGWENTFAESSDFLSLVCSAGFVLKPFGAFDDPEAGWYILGDSRLIVQFALSQNAVLK
ncbi:hypothetical protein [Thalassospira profundimaris]|uniref:hypothetical protein n=1 Tax=Thalassospira profundimaris TaxID=502049 RepID=UPI00028743BD|nr:hypothetical protein [Thalassospira profundimaris]EKF06557.1 hypothetical protein TH2_18481 [Thalassospira profundimaris WP0211]